MHPQQAQPMDLHTAFARYRDAKSQHAASAQDLVALRDFQAAQLIARHGRHPVIMFFADRVIGGIDLGGLEQEPDAAAARVRRLLGSTDAVAAAVEFGAISETLDAAMALALAGGRPQSTNYVRAYRSVGGAEQRYRQLDLAEFVADNLAGIARSRLTYMGFKMARRPARAAGFEALYELLADGFEALREERDADQRIEKALREERALVGRLLG